VVVLQKLVAQLTQRRPDVIAVYVFGSHARGDTTPQSDLDLACLTRHKLDPVERWKLQEELAVLAGRDVDLVDLRQASTVLRVQILRDARMLLDADAAERARFEATALSAYARLNEERKQILADVAATGQSGG